MAVLQRQEYNLKPFTLKKFPNFCFKKYQQGAYSKVTGARKSGGSQKIQTTQRFIQYRHKLKAEDETPKSSLLWVTFLNEL